MGIKTFQFTLSSLVNRVANQGQSCDRRALSYVLLGAVTAATLGTAAQAQTVDNQTSSEALAVAQTAAEPVGERYLFGQVPQPDQIGQGYVVLERTGDRVYGALYYPSSSFDCFEGQVQGTEIAMTVINSYDQADTYPYSLAMVEDSAVASSDASGELVPFDLDGFHAIEDLSENDHRMLEMCSGVVGSAQ
ncbi:hypothetical protein [Phormidium tenue]|uniref:Uncharacterized protein n=1 Tax=Phormidium tenue NIES-30 TaxID=549789 RepID=A0A1U7J053_9CYAN|nr:hypothetical protein [Phormidium tenue]MBD2234345.1 hypothetical protein [Phormidium tenue FACHB-1052]OKH44988.1 hypothetical protein NIES30_21105 [Phormidium tenue NIES-30]